jgi:hypothetical protein
MIGTNETPDVELVAPGKVRVKCAKCHELITLEFGNLTRSEAEEALRKIDVPRECPGYHVELGGWRRLWHFEKALDLAYPPEEEQRLAAFLNEILAAHEAAGFAGHTAIA